MQSLSAVTIGTHHIVNADDGEAPYLSAASGTAWSGPRLYSVGDDQAAIVEYDLDPVKVLEALRAGVDNHILQPGVAVRIIPEVLPLDPRQRSAVKADFEALTIIKRQHIEALPEGRIRAESLRRFPHGLLLIAGSGGVNRKGDRRSIGVVYLLDDNGHIVGLPAKVSLAGLHEFLEQQVVPGKLNIEGICIHGQQVVMAQRGNSLDDDGKPAANMLIRLTLAEFLKSLYTDLRINQCELEEVREYHIGYATLRKGGQTFDVKLDFTDLDSVTGDPHGRLVFTAAAEATGDPAIDGQIAGSVVGVIGADGNIQQIIPLEDTTIKLEGVDARYNPATGSIDLLLVSDADDPEIPAPLMAARIPA